MPRRSPLLAYIECLPRTHLALAQRAAIAVALGSASASAAALADVSAIPHLDTRGRDGYREFLAAGGHRAFVIAPGGVWAWKAGEATAEAAVELATEACREQTDLPCMPYAVDHRVVFDAGRWPTLWGPYPDRAAADRAPVGRQRGQRFFDLALRDPAGRPMKLSDLRGKVVLLHFWGSWCAPCREEMPVLARFARPLGASIRPVFVPVREDAADARAWAARNHLPVTLHDAGATGGDHDLLSLDDGSRIRDRDIARVFPTTYVIDRHGIVAFAHAGPLADWPGLLPFLNDVAARSGR